MKINLLALILISLIIIVVIEKCESSRSKTRLGGSQSNNIKKKKEKKEDEKEEKESEEDNDKDDELELSDLEANTTLNCYQCSGMECNTTTLKSNFKIKCDPGDICWRSKQSKSGLYWRGCASRSCTPTLKTISILNNLTNWSLSIETNNLKSSFLTNICCLKDYCNKAIMSTKINNNSFYLLLLLAFYYY